MNLCLTHEGSTIEADPGQVQQVIMNLITNASEAIGDNAGVITLTTGVQEFDDDYLSRSRLSEKPAAGRFAYVEVSDTGCGMDERNPATALRSLLHHQVHGPRPGDVGRAGDCPGAQGCDHGGERGGPGKHHSSAVPCIRIVRRCRRPASPADHLHPSAQAPLEGTLLVVDDEEGVRGSAPPSSSALASARSIAANGEEALALLERHAHEIGCVLLDLTMPRMDGISTFREMKRLRPDIPVILCSGYDEKEATQHFTGEGLSGFIQKPYGLEELKSTLERVLKRSGTGEH